MDKENGKCRNCLHYYICFNNLPVIAPFAEDTIQYLRNLCVSKNYALFDRSEYGNNF